VDAGVIWGPHDLRAEEQGLKVVIRSEDLSPGHPCCRLAVDRQTLERLPATLERFLRAVLEAEKYAKEHRAETIAAIAKYVKLDPALLEKAYFSGHLDQSSDPNLKGVLAFWKTMQASGFVESKQDISSYVDGSLYKKALDGLALENPGEPHWKQLQKVYAERNI
jgi:NitT/TauT family transport system substrate-binding protein